MASGKISVRVVKKPAEIELIKEGGKKLSLIFEKLFKMVKPGVNLLEIEKKAMELIKEAGGSAAFARVPNYKWATCLNINEGIVHGIPRDYVLKPGDVLNIDIGLFYKGFNTDMSSTKMIKRKKPVLADKEIEAFLKTGKRALKEALKQAKSGNRVGHISLKIQEIVEGAGYGCARNLSGHGIGKKLHEPPSIPCFLKGKLGETPLLKKGMVLAVEVIYTQGKPELETDPQDKWTIRSKDGKITAVFEQTIAVTGDGPLVLTKLPC